MRLLILTARKKKRLTQQDVAEKIGVSKTFYSQIELGNKMPSIKTLLDLQNVLELEDVPVKKMLKNE